MDQEIEKGTKTFEGYRMGRLGYLREERIQLVSTKDNERWLLKTILWVEFTRK